MIKGGGGKKRKKEPQTPLKGMGVSREGVLVEHRRGSPKPGKGKENSQVQRRLVLGGGMGIGTGGSIVSGFRGRKGEPKFFGRVQSNAQERRVGPGKCRVDLGDYGKTSRVKKKKNHTNKRREKCSLQIWTTWPPENDP